MLRHLVMFRRHADVAPDAAVGVGGDVGADPLPGAAS